MTKARTNGNVINTLTALNIATDSQAMMLAIGTTAQRPASPTLGMMRYNTTLNCMEFYDSYAWKPTSSNAPGSVDMLLVGGGQGGASNLGCGGGGGGAFYVTGIKILPSNTYTVTVGAGGAMANGSVGANGGTTSALDESAGGGYGGTFTGGGGGVGGKSGVVTIASVSSRYSTVAAYGNQNGGTQAGNPSAGGGGAGGAGVNNTGTDGGGTAGGIGVQVGTMYDGSNNYYWGGGGGGCAYSQGTGGTGGAGGGGGGGSWGLGPNNVSTGGAGLNNGSGGTNSNSASNGGAAGANTGGGGGAGSHTGGGQSSARAGNGGSGIVCFRYPSSFQAATTSGTVVTNTIGGYRYYAFTSSGTITF